MELSSLQLKKLLYFRRDLAKFSPHFRMNAKIVSCKVFAIIIAIKNWENPCEVSTAARENPCEANTTVSYQDKKLNT